MLIYPNFDPIALTIGPLKIHWYGVMYIIGFFTAWLLARVRIRQHQLDWQPQEISDLVFYVALGVIIGGRLGYVLFYDFWHTWQEPWTIIEIWRGGMSFHGALLGIMVSIAFFAKRSHRAYFSIFDFIAPLAPLGLGAGRLGNFINGELWGRPSDLPWAMIFSHVDTLPRHPSQLYEMIGEGFILFSILWWFSRKPRPRMATSGLFALTYGCCRFLLEFTREPDVQLGFIAFNWVTMGQLLSLLMIIGGVILLVFAYRQKIVSSS